jgi:hypothetical protein
MERLELLGQARHAYERGRRRLAGRTMLLTLPMTAIALSFCHHLALGVPLAIVLVASSAALAWRGGIAGRAVMPGLFAGLAPMLAPLVASLGCTMCGASFSICFPACIAGGIAGGVVVWSHASRIEAGRREFVLVAGTLASMAGTLGCVFLGGSGVLAMIAALAVLLAPAMLLPARSH